MGRKDLVVLVVNDPNFGNYSYTYKKIQEIKVAIEGRGYTEIVYKKVIA